MEALTVGLGKGSTIYADGLEEVITEINPERSVRDKKLNKYQSHWKYYISCIPLGQSRRAVLAEQRAGQAALQALHDMHFIWNTASISK